MTLKKKPPTKADSSESAYEWASKAISCYQLVLELSDHETQFKKCEEGDDSYHQACLHAKTVSQTFFKEILDSVEPHKEKAYDELYDDET